MAKVGKYKDAKFEDSLRKLFLDDDVKLYSQKNYL